MSSSNTTPRQTAAQGLAVRTSNNVTAAGGALFAKDRKHLQKARPRKQPAPEKRDPRSLHITHDVDEPLEATRARVALSPTVQAAAAVQAHEPVSGTDIKFLLKELEQQVDAARDGDLTRPEAMLLAQACTLEAIFNRLARKAAGAQYMDNMETFPKLGLRAQSRCRSTIEALFEMKNPRPVSFVGQANIAHGHQQVNNQVPASRAEEDESGQSKKLE